MTPGTPQHVVIRSGVALGQPLRRLRLGWSLRHQLLLPRHGRAPRHQLKGWAVSHPLNRWLRTTTRQSRCFPSAMCSRPSQSTRSRRDSSLDPMVKWSLIRMTQNAVASPSIRSSSRSRTIVRTTLGNTRWGTHRCCLLPVQAGQWVLTVDLPIDLSTQARTRYNG